MKESDIQKQIFDYCTKLAQQYDIVCFSIPNESLMTALSMFGIDSKTKAMLVNHFKKLGMVSGIPDLCFLVKKNIFFMEIKKPGGKLSKVQEIIHEKLKKIGQTVYTVYSLEEAKEIINCELNNDQ